MDVKLQGDRGQPREAHRTLKTISRVGGGGVDLFIHHRRLPGGGDIQSGSFRMSRQEVSEEERKRDARESLHKGLKPKGI